MDTLIEIRRLRGDFAALGDYATCEMLDKADRAISRWDFEKGWIWLERALEERCKTEARAEASHGIGSYFASCVAALA